MLLPAHPRHADPPHGADGRFYSGGSAHLPDVPEHPTAPPDLRQCDHCGVVQSRWSSLYGQRFDVHSLGAHVTHGTCGACLRQSLEDFMLPTFRRAGLTDAEAAARIDALVDVITKEDATREAWDAQRLAHYQRDHPDYQPRARLAEARRRLMALQQAIVTREGWNPQEQPRGAGGKFLGGDPAAKAEAKATKLLGGAGGKRTSGGKAKAASPKAATDPARVARLAQMKAEMEAIKAKYNDLADHPAHAHLDKAIAATEKSGAKAAGSKRKTVAEVIADDHLTPVRFNIRHEFDPYASPDPQFLHTLYGAAQLRAALGRYPTSALKDTVRERLPAETHGALLRRQRGETAAAYRERLLDQITAWGKQQPLLP